MWEDHPSVEDFRALFRSAPVATQASRRALATRHLLSECPACLERLREIGWNELRLRRLFYLSLSEVRHAETLELPWQGADFSQAFAAAERSLEAFFCRESPLGAAPEERLSELLRLSEAEQVQAVESPRFAHPKVICHLIDQSHAVRYEDHRKMLHLADLARLASGACTCQTAGHELLVADIRARAWMQYGNALRVCGQLQDSDAALAMAQRFQASGTRDPLLRARLLEHMASLRTFQGQLRTAIELADDAGEIYRELGERHFLASTMVQKAIAALYAGSTETGIRTLNQSVPLIDPDENPHLLLAALHNLIRGYIDLKQPEQALSIYLEAKDLYKQFGADNSILLRTMWQEGQLLRDFGHLDAAEATLVAVRKGFVERGLSYEVALVSLDLASVYVLAGKVEEVKSTVSEAIPIFRALRVSRETLGALIQLRLAAGEEQKALDLIRTLNELLAPLSHDQPDK